MYFFTIECFFYNCWATLTVTINKNLPFFPLLHEPVGMLSRCCCRVSTYTTKSQRKSCFRHEFGECADVLVLRGNDAKSPRRELRHPRAMQLSTLPLDCWPALYSTCTLEKITSTGKRSSTRPVSTPTVRLSVCPHRLFFLLLPRSGRAAVHTVCPLGRSASGPKTSCAQINCPDLAVPSPSDSDPDVSRQRKKKGQISIFPCSDYLWHAFKSPSVRLIQTLHPFSPVDVGSNVPGPLFESFLLFIYLSQRAVIGKKG